jgi:hypothetical protein
MAEPALPAAVAPCRTNRGDPVRSIRLHLTVTGQPATATYSTLANLGRLPGLGPAIGSVSGVGSSKTTTVSRWAVDLQRGPASVVAPECAAADGDTGTDTGTDSGRVFNGSWSCVDDGADTAVTFAAQVDMGIAPQAETLEPMAVRTLIDDTVARVSGLFEGNVRVDDVVIQAHQPGSVSRA